MDSGSYIFCAFCLLVPAFFIGAIIWMQKSGFNDEMIELKRREKKKEMVDAILEAKRQEHEQG